MRNEKKLWEVRKLLNAEKHPGALSGNVKSWLEWGNNGPPTQICKAGEIVSSPLKVAEVMNQHFVDKIKNLKKTFQTHLITHAVS